MKRGVASRLALCLLAAVLLEGGDGARPSARTVSALAADFFTSRRVDQVVLFVCGDADRAWLLRSLGADGRFQVEVPSPSSRLVRERLLRGQPVVGVLLWPSAACSSRAALDKLTDAASFDANFRWLLVDPGPASPVIFDSLAAYLRLDSEVTVATPVSDSRWAFFEVFRSDPHLGVHRVSEGFWSPGGVTGHWNPGLAVRRLDVPGIPVKASIYMWKNVDEDVLRRLHTMTREEGLPFISGLAKHGNIIFHNTVTRYKMNITKLIGNPKPGQLVIPPGGQFDGVVGDVERGDADVALALFATPDRERVMIYSPTTWSLKTVCAFLSKGALGSVDALLKVFDARAWLAVAVVTVVIAMMLKNFRALEHVPDDRDGFTWPDVFISTVGTFTGQGFFESGAWVSGRTLLLVFESFCFLTQAYYGAAIVTFLLRPPPTSIRTVSDLVRSHYKGVAHNWVHTRRVLENATDPVLREVYERKLRPPQGFGFLSTPELMAALTQPHIVLIGSDDVLDEAATALSRREACSLQLLEMEPAYHVGVGIRKQAPFKELVLSGSAIQVERGIAQREKTVLRVRRPACDGGSTFAPVDIMPVIPTLVTLAFGVFVASAVCVVERAVHCVRGAGKCCGEDPKAMYPDEALDTRQSGCLRRKRRAPRARAQPRPLHAFRRLVRTTKKRKEVLAVKPALQAAVMAAVSKGHAARSVVWKEYETGETMTRNLVGRMGKKANVSRK